MCPCALHSRNSHFPPLIACDILVSSVAAAAAETNQVSSLSSLESFAGHTERGLDMAYYMWSPKLIQLRTSLRKMRTSQFPITVFKMDWNNIPNESREDD